MNMRRRILEGNLLLPKLGLVVGTQGNLSGYEPKTGSVFIKPSGVPYEEMCEDDIVEIALDGTVLKGTKKPSVDWPHHAFIYKNFPGITGVVHTHSPMQPHSLPQDCRFHVLQQARRISSVEISLLLIMQTTRPITSAELL